MKGKIGDKQRLRHILDAIDEIQKYVDSVTLIEFANNSMMKFATIKQIEIIGEASNYITPETKDKCKDVSWPQIVGMRHILVHEYFGIDTDLIWQVVVNDLPVLKVELLNILDNI